MKRIVSVVLSVAMLLSLCFGAVPAGAAAEFEQRSFANYDEYGDMMAYGLYVPEGAADEKVPLVVYMNDESTNGSDYKNVAAGTAPALLAAANNLINYPCVIFAPQCPEGMSWVDGSPSGEGYTLGEVGSEPIRMAADIIAELEGELNLDPDRYYVIGKLGGASGAYDMLARNPGKFAAAAVIGGVGDSAQAQALAQTKIFAFHGGADETVPAADAQAMAAAIKTCGGDVSYTEIDGGAHDCSAAAYDTPEFFAQLFEVTKNPEDNKIFDASHFDTLDGWTAETSGTGAATAENGILNISTNDGASADTGAGGEYDPEYGKAYASDITASNEGWALSGTGCDITFTDGTMTVGAPGATGMSQGIYNYPVKPDSENFVTEFEMKLDYAAGVNANTSVQLYCAGYRHVFQMWSNSNGTKVNDERMADRQESGKWYKYRVESYRGSVSVMRKAEGESSYTLLCLRKAAKDAQSKYFFKAFIEKTAADIKGSFRNVNIYSSSAWPFERTFSGAQTETFDFGGDTIPVDWTTASSAITLDTEEGALRFKPTDTAAQSIQHKISDFDKAELVVRYKINNSSKRGINFGILSKTRRAAVNVFANYVSLRTYNYKDNKVDFMNVANCSLEKGKWYTLKIVMELYDAATSDYRYAVYRKADGETDFTCLARNLPTEELSRANNFIDIYAEGDAELEGLVDDVSITTWSSQTTGAQKVSKNLTADGTYTAEYKVRLNRDIATNGANVAVYNGGYRSFMRVQPERFTVIGGDGKARAYPIAHEIGKWYTYIVSVKDFETQSIYRRVEDETEFTLVADAIGMQPQKSSRNRIELFIEGNGNQSIDVDYVREYKGLAVDVRELGATTVAELLNGTDAAVGVDAVVAAYDGNTLVGAAISGRQLAAHSSESISLTAGAGESYKLLLWDSANKLAPIDFAR